MHCELTAAQVLMIRTMSTAWRRSLEAQLAMAMARKNEMAQHNIRQEIAQVGELQALFQNLGSTQRVEPQSNSPRMTINEGRVRDVEG